MFSLPLRALPPIPRSTRGLLAALILSTSSVGIFPSSALAQSTVNLSNLIFEPVAIAIEPAPEGEDGSSVIRELTTLPQGDAVDLQTWLRANHKLREVSPDDPVVANDILRYEQSVAATELVGGPYDPGLGEELLALGNAHLQAGDYARALEVFERASHVSRVNHGLFDLDQLPIVEKTIETHLARGDLLAADAQQEYLFYLQRKSMDGNSVDLLPALIRYAEWNIFVYNARDSSFVRPAAEDSEAGAAQAFSDDGLIEFRTQRLADAQKMYQSIVQILRSNFGTDDPRLLETEKQLALANYLFANSIQVSNYESEFMPTVPFSNQLPYGIEPEQRGSPGYREGRDALERRVEYMREHDSSPATLAEAQLDLADWQLVFRKRMGALEMYDEIYAALQSTGAPQAEIDQLFSPALPQEAPAFMPHTYSRQSRDIPAELPLLYKGYVDVEFSLNNYGLPATVTILDASAETPDLVPIRLLRHLRRAQFRPRYANGELLPNDLVHARYYYTY